MQLAPLGEARLILPWKSQKGHAYFSQHAELSDYLAERFGGYTRTMGTGVWIHPLSREKVEEQVVIYDIACPISGETNKDLRNTAEALAIAMEQLEVYLRLPTGAVEFVSSPNRREQLIDFEAEAEDAKARQHVEATTDEEIS